RVCRVVRNLRQNVQPCAWMRREVRNETPPVLRVGPARTRTLGAMTAVARLALGHGTAGGAECERQNGRHGKNVPLQKAPSYRFRGINPRQSSGGSRRSRSPVRGRWLRRAGALDWSRDRPLLPPGHGQDLVGQGEASDVARG